MKLAALFLSTLVSSTIAAPALVWQSERDASASVVHTSEAIHASSLLDSAVNVPSDGSSLAAVVFLVGRDEDGSEALSRLASSGALPGVASKYESAHSVHHHVAGIESTRTVVRDARKALGDSSAENRVLEVSLSEFNSKLTSLRENDKPAESETETSGMVSKATKVSNKRSRALSRADVLVVTVPSKTDASALDNAVVAAIEYSAVRNVVLAGIRSTDEVKHERKLAAHRRASMQKLASRSLLAKNSGRRRLEQEDNNNNQNNNNNNQNNNNNDNSSEGVYYVNMTPNILAGVLYIIFFSFIAYTGISCMGMIAGQDVYVKKLPSIGREA